MNFLSGFFFKMQQRDSTLGRRAVNIFSALTRTGRVEVRRRGRVRGGGGEGGGGGGGVREQGERRDAGREGAQHQDKTQGDHLYRKGEEKKKITLTFEHIAHFKLSFEKKRDRICEDTALHLSVKKKINSNILP